MGIHLAGLEAAVLGSVTLVAAAVNGALGYGFSSITVPVALIFLSNRVLNPAMVLVEVGANVHVLCVNRRALPRILSRTLPLALGVLPGIAAGSYLLYRVSSGWIKLGTYIVLLPVILLQAGGFRRRIQGEKKVALPFGIATGLLYSLTTISGPPLAALLNNQGYPKEEFRAALGLVRAVESVFTAAAYYFLGLYSARSLGLAGAIAPSVLLGIPLGAFVIRRMNPETFRRVCMSFDAWSVGFGLSKALASLHLASGLACYLPLIAVAAADSFMLAWFFSRRLPAPGLASANVS